VMHNLVGNVAEYAFDGKDALAVVKDNKPSTTEIDKTVTDNRDKLNVIGGSSLSPPEVPFNAKQGVDIGDATAGYCDVGFRLAYTAPIESVGEVLANAIKDPKYLPGPKAKG
jgi:hypothetical protein